MKSVIKGKSKLMSEPAPEPEREPEPKLFESQSWSGNKKFRLHNTGRHHKRKSVIVMLLHYVFALFYNALYLWRIVVAFESYHFRLLAALSLLIVIALSLQSALSLYFVIALSNIRKRDHFYGSNALFWRFAA
jgi:hypothetical protein